MKLNKLVILLVVIISYLNHPLAAEARITTGMGMAYNAIKIKVLDKENSYFHTVLQSTVGLAALAYEDRIFSAGIQTGWSDWNVSGEWQGTNIRDRDGDLNGWWLAQQHLMIHAEVRPHRDISIGCRYEEQRLRHHQGEVDITFLHARQKGMDFFIAYNWFRFQGLTLLAEVSYMPRGELDIFHDTLIPEEVFGLHPYEEQSLLNRWQGKIGMVYDDDMGWRLLITYTAGYARGKNLDQLKELIITNGQLLGLFVFRF